ncbi:glycosyltransferase family 4 protein [Ideonella alba]|uniref:Glycosyltransferase family 4 protein n=1 Tax=Ideonella alba TaxID=2824118 RepID=A0A941BDR1_9BURK|nr:glycosyltransferase family 4 protein [Ideonella alba]MBQ0929177.1 glycosyltransferase family 4 protein [Ideonella alba]
MASNASDTERELRILVNAYTCNPYHGSEHSVGWGFIQELARRHRVCVIAEKENCQRDIERFLANCPELAQRAEFHFIEKQRRRLLRKLWPPSYYRYYRKWHLEALNLARHLHAKEPFDLVHQLTMVGYREPGYLWKLGVPFVWGPIGGMGSFPWRFLPSLGLYGALYYSAYNLVNAWQERFAPRPKLAAAAAGPSLISATPEDQTGTMTHWHRPSHLLAEVGLPAHTKDTPTYRNSDEPLRVVWSGLHIPRKALPLGLKALSILPPNIDWTLDILGKGRETRALQRLAENLGIGSRCRFHGWIERRVAIDVMHRAHVMLITSLRDLTSTVTVEALAAGLPVICLDHCGFSSAIDETCGIKVPVTTPNAVIDGFRDALIQMADETRRRDLADGALRRSRLFDWRLKVDRLEEIYRMRLSVDPL